MRRAPLGTASTLLVLILATSCAPPQQGGVGNGATTAVSGEPRRITVAMLGEPPVVWDDIKVAGGTVPGIGQLEELITAGLAVDDVSGLLHPQLAEAVPTTENRLWELAPDGRMRITWKLRPEARWHDGAPFTADDLVFTAQVGQDRELAVLRDPAYDFVDQVTAPDPQTVVISWKEPYIRADRMFGSGSGGFAQPLPKHLLEQPYTENPEAFLQLPYWNVAFVSTGPYQVESWEAGSHVKLRAFVDYVLGRPEIDQIEVKFIAEPSTLVANVLAGVVDLTFSRAVAIEQGMQIRDQWQDGTVKPSITGWTMMYPQVRAPNPPALAEADFRRALIQAIDRDQLAESLAAGMAPVADSIIPPDDATYAAIKDQIVSWPYDPRRTAQLLEGMGFTRGSNGMYRDLTGDSLAVEIRTTTNQANQKAATAVADGLQRAGIAANAVVIPVQRLQDNEYRALYPGLELVNQPDGTEGIANLLASSAAPLPERNYRAPNKSRNRGAYVNLAYDALMDRYLTTVPMTERMRALGEIVHFQTDQQLVMGLYYSVDAILVANRLENVPAGSAWNAHEWRVRS